MWWGADKPDEIGLAPNNVEDILSRLPIFSEAGSVDLGRLAAGSQEARYAAGRRVIREGRIPSHLYVVLSGDLEVWSTGDEGLEPRLINSLAAGDHFGEVGLLEGMPSTATVKTATAASLLRVSATAFLETLTHSPAITSALIERVGGTLARSHPTYQMAAETSPNVQTQAGILQAIDEFLGTLDEKGRADFVREIRSHLDDVEGTN